MSIVYIAGPMTGRENWNVAEFDKAKAEVEAEGNIALSPVDFDREAGFDHFGDECPTPEYMAGVYPRVFSALVACDQVHLLSGWARSKGARAEAMAALWMGKIVHDDVGDFATQEELTRVIVEENSWEMNEN